MPTRPHGIELTYLMAGKYPYDINDNSKLILSGANPRILSLIPDQWYSLRMDDLLS